MQKFITRELEQQTLILTLNRPEKLNSFIREMALELVEALKEANSENVRAVILTGAGRAFCAGQDLASVLPEGDKPRDLGAIVVECYNPIIKAIRECEKPFIAAVNGVAAGAGANLALACDFVIAAQEVSFIQSFSKVGLIPDSGGTFSLPRLVGMARATALTMLGEKLSAADALAAGMIFKVCNGSELLSEAKALAQKLSELPTRGLGLTKKLLNASLSNSLSQQLTLEAEAQRAAGFTADYQEGVAAFVEKRAPRFTGR